MRSDEQSVQIVDIRNMKTAAVLDAYGFTMKSARAETDEGNARVVFTYLVNPERREQFDRLCVLCRAGYNIPLLMSKEQLEAVANSENGELCLSDLPTLGDYERHFQGIRRIIDDFSEAGKDT